MLRIKRQTVPITNFQKIFFLFVSVDNRFDIMIEEEVENKPKKATSAILSYRLQDGKVEIRKPINFEETEIKKFSPILLRWTKVPLFSEAKPGILLFFT